MTHSHSAIPTVFLQHPVYLCFKVSQQIEELTLSHWVFYCDYSEINGRPGGGEKLELGLQDSEPKGTWQCGASLPLK